MTYANHLQRLLSSRHDWNIIPELSSYQVIPELSSNKNIKNKNQSDKHQPKFKKKKNPKSFFSLQKPFSLLRFVYYKRINIKSVCKTLIQISTKLNLVQHQPQALNISNFFFFLQKKNPHYVSRCNNKNNKTFCSNKTI